MIDEDLVVLVRRVRERPAAVDVAERPDALDGGAEHAVGAHVATIVGVQPDAVEVEAVGVRCSPDRHQQVRTVDRIAAGDVHAHTVARRLDPLDRRRRADVETLGGQEAGDLGGDLDVLSRGDPLAALDDRDRAAEPGEELPEFEADVAAAEDHEVVRELGRGGARGRCRATATSSRPGIGGFVARVPTLRNTSSAVKRTISDGDA